MGSVQAMALAGAVEAGEFDLDLALGWHLTAGCYPPLPVTLVPAAKAALAAMRRGEFTCEIALPDVPGLRASAPASEVIVGLRLAEFVGIEVPDAPTADV